LRITVKAARRHGPHEARFSTIHWESEGYYNYCPRDIMLVIGDHNHRTPNVIPQPRPGSVQLSRVADGLYEVGREVVQRPKPMLLDSLFEVDLDKPTPRNDEPAFDAANVLRFGQDLIYLVSSTGNDLGGNGYRQCWATISGSLPQEWSIMAQSLWSPVSTGCRH